MHDRLDVLWDLRPPGSRHARWFAVAMLSSLVPLVRMACGCRDPFLWTAACPWLLLSLPLIGAVHGALAALSSAGILAGLAFAHSAYGGETISPLALRWGLPLCALAVIAGRSADSGHERVERLQAELQQLTAALSRERRSRQVLQVSHRRLAARLPQPASSLQASLDAALQQLGELRGWHERGALVLGVLAEHAAVQAASLFVCSAGGIELSEPAVARLGGRAAPARDLLVQRAFRTARLAMPAEPQNLVAATAEVLAALPLVSEGRVVGVVAIQQLPFEAFEPQRLQEAMLLLVPLAAALAHDAQRSAVAESATPTAAVVEMHWGGIA